MCSEKDYYVAEATGVEGGEEGEVSPNTEPRGTGANKFTYFVTNNCNFFISVGRVDRTAPGHPRANPGGPQDKIFIHWKSRS